MASPADRTMEDYSCKCGIVNTRALHHPIVINWRLVVGGSGTVRLCGIASVASPDFPITSPSPNDTIGRGSYSQPSKRASPGRITSLLKVWGLARKRRSVQTSIIGGD